MMDCNTVSASPHKNSTNVYRMCVCVCMKESAVLLRWQIDLKSASAFVRRVNNDESTKNERLRMIVHARLPPLLFPLHRLRSKLCHSFINLKIAAILFSCYAFMQSGSGVRAQVAGGRGVHSASGLLWYSASVSAVSECIHQYC